jgi:hypothetical protein
VFSVTLRSRFSSTVRHCSLRLVVASHWIGPSGMTASVVTALSISISAARSLITAMVWAAPVCNFFFYVCTRSRQPAGLHSRGSRRPQGRAPVPSLHSRGASAASLPGTRRPRLPCGHSAKDRRLSRHPVVASTARGCSSLRHRPPGVAILPARAGHARNAVTRRRDPDRGARWRRHKKRKLRHPIPGHKNRAGKSNPSMIGPSYERAHMGGYHRGSPAAGSAL